MLRHGHSHVPRLIVAEWSVQGDAHVAIKAAAVRERERVQSYFAKHAGHRGIKAARLQYEVWLEIVGRARWRIPEDVKASYPKVSILKAGPVVFNIKGNDFRLVSAVQYRAGVLAIRFFGIMPSMTKSMRRPRDGCNSDLD
jgi:mRNA interferase HigB